MNIHTHHVGEGINILDVGEGKAWVEKEKRRELVEGQNVFYSVGVHPMKLNDRRYGTDKKSNSDRRVRFGPSLSYLHENAGRDTGSSSPFGGRAV